MKSALVVFTALILLISTTQAEPFYVPSYYPQSDFLVLTPGASGSAAGAFFNPAVWGMMKGSELQVLWNDADKNALSADGGLKNWALAFGGPGGGFTMQQWDFGYTSSGTLKRYTLKDYQIAISGGNAESSFGISYSWSRGATGVPGMERDNVLSMGTLTRHNKYVSVGMAGHYALTEKDIRGVLDIGVRPLGTPMVTIYTDAAMASNENLSEVKWAVGASVEPVPGIALVGKYFEDGSYMGGLTFTLSGLSLSALPHFNKDNEQTYSTYGVRVGFPKPDMLSDKITKEKLYLDMTFNNAIKYQRYKLFDRKGHTLTELLETLELAKNNPAIAGLAVKITEEMYGTPEMIWEVREKMKELQAEGKKIVVFLERGGMWQYYLASVADKVMVDPECTVAILGFNFGRSYYRNLLDKLGIGFDEWRFFKYKSAMEGFSRTDMSEGDKEQLGALAEGFYDTYRTDICASRDITTEHFDYIVNEVVIMNADSLIHYGLADTTGRWDEIGDLIKEMEGKSKGRISKNTLMAMEPIDDIWGVKPRIAIIYGLGPCAMNYGLNARRLAPIIKRAREDKRIKAVVFRADSPGGDVLPSDIVAEELKKTAEKKPVIVSQGWVAGSGGYWISMYGDKIVASPWSITGSIGVIGGWFYDNGFNEKIGLSYDHTQVGKHADLSGGAYIPFVGGIPYRNLTSEERLMMEKRIRLMYQGFLEKVAEGRDMDKDEVHEVAQGRIWTGTAGKKIGLVDELGGLELAIQMARDAADIETGQIIEIVEMPSKGHINPDFFRPKMFGIDLFKSDKETGNPDLDYIRMLSESKGYPVVMVPPELYSLEY
ncbi:signal peptide peptidase SppA [bacterium]|nr:signal peptide peptidase SppA [bacterium]